MERGIRKILTFTLNVKSASKMFGKNHTEALVILKRLKLP